VAESQPRCDSDRVTDLPVWEQRMRAPQLLTWSLLGPPVLWAGDESDPGVVLATTSGRTEVHAFDAATSPATLVQVTDRPDGTSGGTVSPDGSTAFWFDDSAGDEVGRWQRVPVGGGEGTTVLPALAPAYPGGIVPLRDGRVAVGRLIDVAPGDDVAFEVAVAGEDGDGTVVYQGTEPAELAAVSHDATLALLNVAPGGNFLRLGLRVVRLADGSVVGELFDEGLSLNAVAFDPSDSRLVLFGHERRDHSRPAVWDLESGEQSDVATGLTGDVTAQWYPDGDALLLTVLRDARHELFRYDRATGVVTPVETPRGTVHAASARPDGSVHVLVSSTSTPPTLVRSHDGRTAELVRLPGDPPAESVSPTDVYADGPGGRVHALLVTPPGRAAPYPTLFRPHGGPTGQDFDMWNDRDAGFVDAGYAVVKVNYRGSTGYGAAWRDALHERLGFIELEDLGAVRAHLESAGVVDPARVSILGGSWGGYLTLMALGTEPDRWRSGGAMVPLADYFTSAEDAPSFMVDYDAGLMGGRIEDIPDFYRAASPITYVDAVTAPLFVTAGENDPRCPVRQVDTYVERLRARGHDVQYERVHAGHAIPTLDLKVTEMRQLLDFLARTLPVD
jgi:dipeptidyl aminopeptidase/acylaminoacyl peptidase